jgi:glycosyltransferase involved in cell wall biosynthesis
MDAALGGHAARPALAVVLKGYPRLSETFIAQEIFGLEQRGLSLLLVSLRRPTDRTTHPIHARIRAPIVYLPEYLYREPLRVFRSWRRVRRRAGYGAAWRTWLADLRRDPTPNRIRRFGQALVLAAECPDSVGHLYAHFLHTPASVARYAASIVDRTWSVSAHAKDIWTTPDWEKREKLDDAVWAVVCTEAGRRNLAALSAAPNKVDLVYHGLDLASLPAAASPELHRDGGTEASAVTVLSVGRAVAKKGYDDLVAALAALPPDLHWRFVHIGGGPLLKKLRAAAKKRGIAERIDWLGQRARPEVFARYGQADVFVLASRIAADGDRDGLPNVLMEAQSQGVACVATAVSGVPELIVDGETGLLVPPDDPAALAKALHRLIRDVDLRRRLATAGMRRVRQHFAAAPGLDRIAAKLSASLAHPRRAPQLDAVGTCWSPSTHP